MLTSSLTVVGSGIKFMSHLTVEVKAHIEQSDKVLYLVNEPAIKEWIQTVNPNSESLDSIYSSQRLRLHSYQAITHYILETLRQKQHLCVVFYGHPAVFSTSALDAVCQAKKEGYYAKILPGISAEDCLFADLLIDPGSHGCLSLEATDLLIHQKKLDVNYHLILWQVGLIGTLIHPKLCNNTRGLQLLLDYLKNFYEMNHPIVLYSAAQYPGLQPIIKKSTLKNLTQIKFSRISILYLPPGNQPNCDETMLKALNINVSDLIS